MNEFNFIAGLLARKDTESLELAEALLSRSTNANLLKNIHKHIEALKTSIKENSSKDIEQASWERRISIERQLSRRLGI